MGVHVFPILNPSPTSLPIHPSAPALSTLSHVLNLDWWSILHMIIYMFQCYSLKSSHPCLLPQSPKHCSIQLCLFCCLAYRVIITIFLNSIYICISILYSCPYVFRITRYWLGNRRSCKLSDLNNLLQSLLLFLLLFKFRPLNSVPIPLTSCLFHCSSQFSAQC